MSRKRIYFTALASLTSLAGTISAWSQVAISVTNAGFEDDSLSNGSRLIANDGGPAGWTGGYYTAGNLSSWAFEALKYRGAYNPDSDDWGGSADEGLNVAFVQGYSGYYMGLIQVLADVLVAEGEYDLSVRIGNPGGTNGGAATVGYRIELLAGATRVDFDQGDSPATNTWATASLNYVAPAAGDPLIGQPLGIRIIAINDGVGGQNGGPEVHFDDVKLTATLAPLVFPPLLLTIEQTGPGPDFDLTWGSEDGWLYNLRQSADLTGDISSWGLVEGDIVATPPTNTKSVSPSEDAMFYAVEQYPETPGTLPGWRVLPNSPVAPYYHHDDLFFIDENTGWLCNISGEVWKTTDGGDSWRRVLYQPSPLSSFRCITFLDENNGWVGQLGSNGWSDSDDTDTLYATTDGGETWAPVSATDLGHTHDSWGLCGIKAVGTDTIHSVGRYAPGHAHFVSSRDAGATWTSSHIFANYNGALRQMNGAVDLYFFTPERGYVSANYGNRALLLYTDDGGANWTVHHENRCYHHWKLAFASPTFGYGVCWSGPDHGKWIQTIDGGATWTDHVYTNDANSCDANGIGFWDEQTGWIGCHGPDTYETTDGGASWHKIKIDPVYDDSINKFLRVGDVMYGIGNRIYKYSTDPVRAPRRAQLDNSRCKLAADPILPDGTTTITYTVPEDGNAQVTIYVPGGLIVARPVDEHHEAGTYTIEFNVPDEPADLFFNREPDNPDKPRLHASIVTGAYRQMIAFEHHPEP